MADHALPKQRKYWALAVLACLRERPMHPYEIRCLIRERHKEQRLGIKPGSLYHAVEWLQKKKLIESTQKDRAGKRPERTVYRILKAGEERLLEWLREMLTTPVKESSSFAVALDHTVHLDPAAAVEMIQARAQVLEAEVGHMEYALKMLAPTVGRVNLLEVEFEQVIRQAEVAWLRTLTADIQSGVLNWNIEEILARIRSTTPPAQPPAAKD